jgi:hypothetical protein
MEGVLDERGTTHASVADRLSMGLARRPSEQPGAGASKKVHGITFDKLYDDLYTRLKKLGC